MTSECPATPECDKLLKKGGDRRLLEQFLEWISAKQIWLARYDDDGEIVWVTAHNLPTEFLGIDPKKLEEERRALLDYQRELTENTP